jgi:hypothetical protein
MVGSEVLPFIFVLDTCMFSSLFFSAHFYSSFSVPFAFYLYSPFSLFPPIFPLSLSFLLSFLPFSFPPSLCPSLPPSFPSFLFFLFFILDYFQ